MLAVEGFVVRFGGRARKEALVRYQKRPESLPAYREAARLRCGRVYESGRESHRFVAREAYARALCDNRLSRARLRECVCFGLLGAAHRPACGRLELSCLNRREVRERRGPTHQKHGGLRERSPGAAAASDAAGGDARNEGAVWLDKNGAGALEAQAGR